MFFEGDLQAGIAKALQEKRLVGCFVYDGSAASSAWESWLADDQIRSLAEEKVVLLRLQAGSQEASFLAAFCPIPSVPSVIVIDNGQVASKLTSDLSEADFKSDLRAVLAGGVGAAPPAAAAAPQSPSTPARPATQSATSPSAASDSVQTVLAERSAPLNEDKKAKEAADAAERKARAEARRVSAEGAGGADERRGSQSSHAKELRKAQAEARAERERILQRIEDDKRARKEREAHRRAQSKSEAEARSSTDNRPGSGGSMSPSFSTIRECAIQVRLFDGSTIRQRFSTWKTLRTHVRPWIDSHRTDGDGPYSLRQVLVPMPNRSIEIAEEDEDLDALGLYPSATLVMVPVKDFADAYGGAGSGVAKGVSAGYSIVNGIGNAIGSLFSRSPPSSPPAGSSFGPRSPAGVRTLGGEGEDGDEHHLYNGSGLNVEPQAPELKREDSWG